MMVTIWLLLVVVLVLVIIFIMVRSDHDHRISYFTHYFSSAVKSIPTKTGMKSDLKHVKTIQLKLKIISYSCVILPTDKKKWPKRAKERP